MAAVKLVRSKYGAVKTQIDGITFASKAEARHYQELRQLERAGLITELQLQPRFELAKAVRFAGAARATPALRYQADFAYRNAEGKRVVSDVKGHVTEGYRIKRHLMLAIHGIEVQEVRYK